MKNKTIKLAFVACCGLYLGACGSSGGSGTPKNPDVSTIIQYMKQLAGCTGKSYVNLSQAQIDNIEKVCTAAELSAGAKYLACIAPAICAKDQSAATKCGNPPALSQACAQAGTSPGNDSAGVFGPQL